MEEHFVWMTTRRIKPGTLAQFEGAWRPDTHPEGMLRADTTTGSPVGARQRPLAGAVARAMR